MKYLVITLVSGFIIGFASYIVWTIMPGAEEFRAMALIVAACVATMGLMMAIHPRFEWFMVYAPAIFSGYLVAVLVKLKLSHLCCECQCRLNSQKRCKKAGEGEKT